MSKTVKIARRETCRACDGTLEDILDFGIQYIVNFGDKPSEKAPLVLTKCAACHLVQLRDTVDPEFLFRKYYYKSGVNATMRDHLRGIVEDVTKRVTLKKDDIVIDIGSNDGTLLSFYPKIDFLYKIGFEPAKDLAKEAIRNGATTVIEGFFTASAYLNLYTFPSFEGVPKAKIITAISMFYDLDDPNAFLQDIKKVLAPDGLFVIQMNYLPAMLENNAVDNIVHEHLTYYSLTTLNKLLERNELEIVDVTLNDLNGGSFRVFVRHQLSKATAWGADSPYDRTVGQIYRDEANLGLDTLAPYKAFRDRVAEIVYRLQTFIPMEKFNGRTTYIYGASTRGATLLQYAGLDEKAIPYAVERNPDKVGTMYLGKFPTISEESARKHKVDYYLILPHYFLGEFVVREEGFLLRGGKFIIPLPQPRILEVKSL